MKKEEKKYSIGYTKKELVQMGISLDEFNKFMYGQTFAIIDCEEVYYNEDVKRFRILHNQ